MKKKICVSLTALSLLAGTAAFSSETKATMDVKSTPVPAVNKAPETTISLYESPEVTSKVIKTLSANTQLIGIFQKGDWVKVGDQQDGTTGWLNLKQYHEAKHHFYRQHLQPHVETTFISTVKDKEGKTTIEAYQNGKKVVGDAAKKVYEKMQQQERNQWEAMQRFNQSLYREMRTDYLQEKQEVKEPLDLPVFFIPGLVIIKNPTTTPPESSTQKVESSDKK